MISEDKIIEVEWFFPKLFSTFKQTDDYIVFYDDTNKISFDANHAILYALNNNVEANIDAVTDFYLSNAITPRFYPAFYPNELSGLRNTFEKKGFTIEINSNKLFYRMSKIILNDLPRLDIRRITTPCEEIKQLYDDEPWSIKVIEKCVASECYYFYVGYMNAEPVVSAAINNFLGLSRLDDVKTIKKYRGNKYCQSLLNTILNNEVISPQAKQYLYASEKDAIHIYEKLGYKEHPNNFEFWSASK